MPHSLPVIDQTALARLQRMGGPEFVLKMIELFLKEAPDRVAAALRGETGGDLAAVAAAAHALKSSAANFGAERLVSIATALEKSAARGKTEIGDLMRALETESAAAMTQLAVEKQSLLG